MLDDILKFRRGQRSGKYSQRKYPNLMEIYEYLPTSYFANVTDELMLAVFEGKEDLTATEMARIAFYNSISFNALVCPKLILLDRGNHKHWQMMGRLKGMFCEIWDWKKKGSKYAEDYMNGGHYHGCDDFVNMNLRFRNGETVTYGHYLGVKHCMEDTIYFAKGEFREQPRGLRNKEVSIT